VIRLVERLSDTLATVSAWLFFAIGAMISYEVAARYFFNAPTIWAEEMSRFLQIWATYLAAATLVRGQHLIRITLVVDRLGPRARLASELLSLAFMAAFAAVAAWYGLAIVQDSVALGRATSTMLAVPRWATESAIPVGCLLLAVQCITEMVRKLLPDSSAGAADQ
jgi:TRAP-type C4-dicarboxylate transport system permease small subunit